VYQERKITLLINLSKNSIVFWYFAQVRSNIEKTLMPAKPVWYSDLEGILQALRALPRPFVDRATVEALLGVGRRRAQQIMAPCITDHVGANGLVDRDVLIERLQRVAEGDNCFYERTRRRRVAEHLEGLRKDRLERPQLLVEAPLRILTQEFVNLPAGVGLEPGRITVTFNQPQEALEKLLALAMAISNDFELFEHQVRSAPA
jgi:hypothetical protein